jgi:hypothetical protein
LKKHKLMVHGWYYKIGMFLFILRRIIFKNVQEHWC